jgi:hypothetical protein
MVSNRDVVSVTSIRWQKKLISSAIVVGVLLETPELILRVILFKKEIPRPPDRLRMAGGSTTISERRWMKSKVLDFAVRLGSVLPWEWSRSHAWATVRRSECALRVGSVNMAALA